MLSDSGQSWRRWNTTSQALVAIILRKRHWTKCLTKRGNDLTWGGSATSPDHTFHEIDNRENQYLSTTDLSFYSSGETFVGHGNNSANGPGMDKDHLGKEHLGK